MERGEPTAFQRVARRVAEPATIKLVTRGRSTGLPHIAVMRFALSEGCFLVIAGSKRNDWFLNALAGGRAKVRLGETVQEAACEEFAEVETARRLFARKYGPRVVKDWYSGEQSRALKLTPTSAPTRRGGILGEGGAKMDFTSWKAQGADYRGTVVDAFDSASEEYDFTIGGNFINVWIRDRSISEVLALARPDDVLLEVGCGTGTEALRISRWVAGVVATDISPGMVSILRTKVKARNLSAKVVPLELAAADVRLAGEHLRGGKARLVYSFNGALNCELELGRFVSELSRVMEPGGFFVCSVRNRLCIEESLVQAALLRFRSMSPRKKQPKMVSVGGMDVPAYYYYPWEFAKYFRGRFEVRKQVALPAVIPPPYLNDTYVKVRSRVKILERADASLADKFPFNRFGDQTLFVFRLKDGNARAA